MQYGIDALIIVNGKDKTDSIVSCKFRGEKCDIVYHSGSRVYSYNSANVRILKLVQEIEPKSVIFKAKGRTYTEIDRILYFGEFYRIIRANRKDLTYSCLAFSAVFWWRCESCCRQ